MEKIPFMLNLKGQWPPVSCEHAWCEKTGEIYQLKNAPFFIDGLAFDDKFIAEPNAVTGCIDEFDIVESSGHSLVWIIDQANVVLSKFMQELVALGLNIEGFPKFDLHAVDVPTSVDTDAVNVLMDRLEGLGFAMAFPVWRPD